jgi:small subunit ribosomal protein S2
MAEVGYNDLLDAGVHFGHLKRKWNPKMAPYIFMERNGIHIIDLNKTLTCLETACNAMRDISRKGKKVLFVATKKQAKDIVASEAERLKMPYVTERWLGGMLTNFATVRKSIKKLASIDKMAKSENYQYLAKREKLMLEREKEKLQRVLGGIVDQVRLPSALFIVDVKREHIAVREAKRLGIPVFGIVDTNSDPSSVDFPIPANDDAYKSIALITKTICSAIEEGMLERKRDKDETAKEDGGKDGSAEADEEIIDETDDLLADLEDEE